MKNMEKDKAKEDKEFIKAQKLREAEFKKIEAEFKKTEAENKKRELALEKQREKEGAEPGEIQVGRKTLDPTVTDHRGVEVC